MRRDWPIQFRIVTLDCDMGRVLSRQDERERYIIKLKKGPTVIDIGCLHIEFRPVPIERLFMSVTTMAT
jgi:hypothetical protein